MQVMNGELQDHAIENGRRVGVRVTIDDNFLHIYPDGYGEYDATPGHGAPVILELHNGSLSLHASPDINAEKMTVIDLEGAREDRRLTEPLNFSN